MGFIYENDGKVTALMTNSQILKNSNFGLGRWLGGNDHLLRP